MTLAELLEQKPASPGVPLGAGDWRLVVEVLLQAEGSAMWGLADWDEGEWGELAWFDLTPWVRGAEWTRGNDEYLGRPRVGEARITIANPDGAWSPWNPAPPAGAPAFFGPGTLIRIAAVSDTDPRADGWLPQICVIVDDWLDGDEGLRADRWDDITGVETVSLLAAINDNALAAAAGAGETGVARITRLLNAAAWPYGLDTAGAIAFFPLQATNMAANRLAECYLTADSSLQVFLSGPTGAAVFRGAQANNARLAEFSVYEGGTGLIGFAELGQTGPVDDPTENVLFVPFDADSVVPGNDALHIINEARWARAGGAQQIHRNLSSISRYGLRSSARSDLINTSDADVANLAFNHVGVRCRHTLRVKSLTVSSSARGDDAYLAMLALDVSNWCHFVPVGSVPGAGPFAFAGHSGDNTTPFLIASVGTITHRVTPLNPSALTWQTELALDTSVVENIPGAFILTG